MHSLWEATVEIPRQNMLLEDIQAEVAVIGGGMAGLLTAYLLRESGVDAVVLEADRVAGGQTGRTTAKITSQHGLIYDTLFSQCGREAAQKYAAANQQAIEEYARLIEKHTITCDFERLPAFVYSTAETKPLLDEMEAARGVGLPAAYTDTAPLPFPITGAVRFDNQAQFHPLRFLQEIVKHVPVYEQARVRTVEPDGPQWRLQTDTCCVRSRSVVFACHYPFLNTPGYYFLRMHQERSYVIALEGAEILDGMYIGAAQDGLSLRNHGSALLLGGGGHRTGENSAGGKYAMLLHAAKSYYPGCKEIYRWSAQDCMPHDNVPYIGPYCESKPGWYVATGFKKWGMTTSMAAAILLRDAILGKENPNASVFSPQRSFMLSAISPLVTDGVQAVKGLLREKLSVPQASLDALPNGHGGVVEADGVKVGVYKDDVGEVFLVDTRCPHLGCQLEWNPDEKSWDCPCHGSRFDIHGKLMDDPAQTDAGAL